MMSRELPAKPNLEHLKNQAKDLLRSFEQDDAAAKERFAGVSLIGQPRLADALHAVAREYGFPNWAKLKEHVESLTRILTPAEQLTAAIRKTDADKVVRLLENHPELKAAIDEPLANYRAGLTPLLAAVQHTDPKTIDVLLGAGADINVRSRDEKGGIGVLDECDESVAAFLMERGATLDAHSAARLGMIEQLRQFIAANPELVDAPGFHGQTPLHFASTVEIAQFLVDHGAEIDARDLQHSSTPAQHMIRVMQARHYRRDRQDVARYLVARGCQTDTLMAAALGDLALVRQAAGFVPQSTTYHARYFTTGRRVRSPSRPFNGIHHQMVFAVSSKIRFQYRSAFGWTRSNR
jgi:hypothetical protein